MRLTEEQVVNRLAAAEFTAMSIARVMGMPAVFPESLAFVGVRWTGEHYVEEGEDGQP